MVWGPVLFSFSFLSQCHGFYLLVILAEAMSSGYSSHPLSKQDWDTAVIFLELDSQNQTITNQSKAAPISPVVEIIFP